MSKTPITITQSEVSDFTRCRYKWYLTYIQLITPKVTPTYFEDGSAFHNALENLGNGMDMVDVAKGINKDFDGYIKEYKGMLSQDIVDDYNKRLVAIQGMVAGYHKLYGDEYSHEWTLVDAEEEFHIELTPGVFVMGKKDKRIRKVSDGKLYLVEHKSAGAIPSSYINKLPRDQQTLTYAWADWKDHPEEPVSGVIYDVTKKPKIRQKKNEERKDFLKRIELLYTEQPEKYFYRETLRYDPKRLKTFEDNLKVVASHMQACIEEPKKNVYRSWPTACDDFGGCAYKEICNKQSLKGPHMKGYSKRETKHQELAPETQTTKGKR